MRGGRLRFVLAAGSAILVAAVAFASARDSSTGQVGAPQGSADSFAGTPISSAKGQSTPEHMYGYATPRHVPALRTLKSAPYKAGGAPENDFEGYPSRLAGSSTVDPVVQRSAPKDVMPPPIANFDGVSVLCGCSPPDTEGDVGPNHYMQWVNLHYAIYNKTGQLLVGPLTGNSLFQGGQSPYCGARNRGDPIVLYDQYAQRWMVSQFAFDGNGSTPPFYQCIAVSTTSDPTGTWCAYDFLVHQVNFNDYPKFGIWPAQNTYTMTAPQFNSNGGQGVWGFERDKMLACQTAGMAYQDLVTFDPNLPRILPADADGATMPPANAPQPIVTDNDDGAGYPDDRVDVMKAVFTWSPTPSVSVTREGFLPTADFDQDIGCVGRACIPQPGTTNKVDALPNRPMYRLAYRNYGTYQAMTWVHTVDADAPSGNRAGTRWYELRKFTGGNWGIQNQGTFGPADGMFRWMGAGAMDKSGDLAIGYSIGNGTAPNFPSIAYAGRLVTDPPNELSQGEGTLHLGTGAQTGSMRWGDYSMMSTDPTDDCTFWYTTEYLQASGTQWRTRIGSFKFPSCGPPPPGPTCPAGATVVTISDFAFTPQNVNVAPGTTVCWQNNGPSAHTVTSDTGLFGSEMLNPGQIFTYTFTTNGVYA